MEALTVLLILFMGAIGIYMFFTGPTSFLTFILLFAVLAFILVHFKFITIDISKSKEIGIDFTGQPVPTVNVPESEELHPVRDFFERMENFITGKGWYLDSEIEAAQKAIKSANTMKSSTEEALRAAKAAKIEAEKAEKAAKLASDEAGKITPDAAKISALSPASANCTPISQEEAKKMIQNSRYYPRICKNSSEQDMSCAIIGTAIHTVESNALSQECTEAGRKILDSIVNQSGEINEREVDLDIFDEKLKEKCTIEVKEYLKTGPKKCTNKSGISTGTPLFEDKSRELSFGIKYTS
jgi:hypothetical protein